MEILAPAGSAEALTAAVRCGADAVYLGTGAFNARRHAGNFDGGALAEAVSYCHARGVRVHLTLNTLVRGDEMGAALSVAELACRLGADALIVQDVGLASRIRASAPDMPLHASTQLSCHTPAGVRELAEAGFRRVVLAREMSAQEIAACAGQGCELEMFVHGALCMSVSGQCYLSAMLGGRSGNRGLCAQPCRLPFACGHRPQGEAALSLRDLSLLSEAGRLSELGVCSLKIEGRMKRPEYVAAAVTAYRAAVRGETPDPQIVEDLQAVFSRSGFTDGYYSGRRSADMFGMRRYEDVLAAGPAVSRLQALYAQETPLVAVDMTLTVAAGKPASLHVCDGEGHGAFAGGPAPEIARHRPLDAGTAAAQLHKCGGTPFYVRNAVCRIDEGLTLPLSAINALRREALETLLNARSRPFVSAFDPTAQPEENTVCPAAQWKRAADGPRIVARYALAGQASPGDGADIRVLPLSADDEALRMLAVAGPLGVEVPRGLFGKEDAVRRRLADMPALGVRYALCGNVGALPLAREAGLMPVGGFGLNLTNADAVAWYAARGLAAALLSMELRFSQVDFAMRTAIPTGLLAYGRQPLMLMRNCPLRAQGGCRGTAKNRTLTDRKGVSFPVRCDAPGGVCAENCSELLNAVPLYLADRLEEIPPLDFLLLHFTDELPEQAKELLCAYRAGGPPREGITRGLYRRGTE